MSLSERQFKDLLDEFKQVSYALTTLSGMNPQETGGLEYIGNALRTDDLSVSKSIHMVADSLDQVAEAISEVAQAISEATQAINSTK